MNKPVTPKSADSAKKKYVTPKLTKLGTVKELTQIGVRSNNRVDRGSS
ncbi:MAG: lasso RiPP family leader peptide-containing protein [Bacteroidetes bacterium]|nr:lasso RiPP family leader peptide-containing protein [Bacteroidota bacterium]